MSTLIAYASQGWHKIDRAWAASALILLALALLVPAQAHSSVLFTIDAVVEILPYILVAIGLAAYAGATGADNLIAKAFSGNIIAVIPLAAVVGAFSPFCSCGVIPLIAALLAVGVPLAPVMAFWLASPLMDPSMFMITAGELGMTFAIAKTVIAVAMGLFGGFGILALSHTPMMENPLRDGIGNGGCGGAKIRAPKPVNWTFWQEAERRTKFSTEGVKNTLFLLKWLTLAYLIESLMLAYTPAGWVAQAAGDGSLLSITIAALIGVPTYLNGYAAVPLVAGLLKTGMAAGAGMSFLIAGGVTSLPAAIAVYALARLPVFFLYLGFSLTGAVAAGLAYQALSTM